jgi:hypothetical protein
LLSIFDLNFFLKNNKEKETQNKTAFQQLMTMYDLMDLEKYYQNILFDDLDNKNLMRK